jgi:hypothetical protein
MVSVHLLLSNRLYPGQCRCCGKARKVSRQVGTALPHRRVGFLPCFHSRTTRRNAWCCVSYNTLVCASPNCACLHGPMCSRILKAGRSRYTANHTLYCSSQIYLASCSHNLLCLIVCGLVGHVQCCYPHLLHGCAKGIRSAEYSPIRAPHL